MTNRYCRIYKTFTALFALCLLGASQCIAADMIKVLPGTEVRLHLNEVLSSKLVRKGQSFKLVVEKDVRVRGQVVVPKGTLASGIVVRTSASSVGGKPGEVYVRVEYLILNGQRIALFSGSGQRGKGSDGAAVVLTALFGPIGILTRGKEVVFPVGMPFLAYIDQAFEVPVDTLINTSVEKVSALPNAVNTEAQVQTSTTPENAVRIDNVETNDKP